MVRITMYQWYINDQIFDDGHVAMGETTKKNNGWFDSTGLLPFFGESEPLFCPKKPIARGVSSLKHRCVKLYVKLFPEIPKAGGFWAWFEHVLTVDLPLKPWIFASRRRDWRCLWPWPELSTPTSWWGELEMLKRPHDTMTGTGGLDHFGPFWTNMFYDFPDDWEYFIPTDFYIFQRDWNHQPEVIGSYILNSM